MYLDSGVSSNIVLVNAAAVAALEHSRDYSLQCGYIIQEQCKCIIGCHALQCADGHGSHSLTFSCRKLSLHTHTQAVSMLEQIATQHQAKKNWNCCMYTLLHELQPSFLGV